MHLTTTTLTLISLSATACLASALYDDSYTSSIYARSADPYADADAEPDYSDEPALYSRSAYHFSSSDDAPHLIEQLHGRSAALTFDDDLIARALDRRFAAAEAEAEAYADADADADAEAYAAAFLDLDSDLDLIRRSILSELKPGPGNFVDYGLKAIKGADQYIKGKTSSNVHKPAPFVPKPTGSPIHKPSSNLITGTEHKIGSLVDKIF